MLRELGVAEPERVAADVVARTLATMEPFPDAAATLAELKRRGYRLALVSNVSSPGAAFAEALRRAGVAAFLDEMVFSFDVGARKPDPAIFREALRRLGSAPERAAHAGDLLSSDVKGARAAGLLAVHVDRGPHPDERGGPEPDVRVRSLAELREVFP
jgi:putative hydrolase of the HAD superfamily